MLILTLEDGGGNNVCSINRTSWPMCLSQWKYIYLISWMIWLRP